MAQTVRVTTRSLLAVKVRKLAMHGIKSSYSPSMYQRRNFHTSGRRIRGSRHLDTFADGNPTASMVEFDKVLDHFAIMNYDTWSIWADFVGPSSPIDSACAEHPGRSAVSSVAAWTKAGIPTNKLVLGVPSYGHSYRVYKADAFTADGRTLASYPKFDKGNQTFGNTGDDSGTNDCGVHGGPSGYFDFYAMIDAGILNQEGKPVDGIIYRFDDCSKTPFLYDPKKEMMISYDDPDSFRLKGKFIKDNGLLGWAMWEANSDHNNLLVDSIQKGIAGA